MGNDLAALLEAGAAADVAPDAAGAAVVVGAAAATVVGALAGTFSAGADALLTGDILAARSK